MLSTKGPQLSTPLISSEESGIMESQKDNPLSATEIIMRDTSVDLKVDFQERFATKTALEAFAKIKRDLTNNKELEAAALHIGASGLEVGQEVLLSVWTQLQLISALIGGLSMTILVSSPSPNFAFNDEHMLSAEGAKRAAYCFYLFWSLASFFELAAVVLVTVAQLHYSIMLDALDALWFIDTWKIYVWILPRMFVVCGCASAVLGCISAVFLVANIYIASAILVLGLLLMFLIVFIWITMLHKNSARKKESLERYKTVLNDSILSAADKSV